MIEFWAWIGSVGSGILLLIAITLLILYFRGVFRERLHYQIQNLPSPTDPNFAFTVACLSDSFMSHGKFTGFWVEAEAIYQARLEAIGQAENIIQFETYFMTPGKRADEFAEALAQKAKAGVRVQFLADNFGTFSMPQDYWKRLQAAGVEVRFFNKLSWKDLTYHLKRNHRKLLTIDQKLALIGGAGISDFWDGVGDDIEGTVPWCDYEVGLIGPVVPRLRGIFIQHWLDADGTADFAHDPLHFNPKDEPLMLITSGEDPSYRDSEIRALYQSLIVGARSRVWIASPYFLPDPNSREMLLNARQKGVEVRILTMSENCDKPFIHYTAQEIYPDLLKGGIEIYEYQPSMMHAKALLIDDQWVSLGSANFDPRSFFKNDELNVSLSDESLIKEVESFFQTAFSKSKLVNRRQLKHRSLKERLIGRFCLLFFWHL